MIACPFYFCSCCRWQHSSARRAVSNNPRPGSVRGFFCARSPQAAPGAARVPQSPAPVRMYARHPLAPSASVLARRGHACAAPAIPAEYAPPLTTPLKGVLGGFYVPHTSDRVNAFSRALRPSGAPCSAVRVVPSRGMCSRPVKDPPRGRKGTRPEASHIPAAFPSGFSIRFSSRIFSARDRPICVP